MTLKPIKKYPNDFIVSQRYSKILTIFRKSPSGQKKKQFIKDCSQ